MRAKELSGETGRRQWAVVFDEGEEVSAGLLALAGQMQLRAAHFTGIGALRSAILGWFDCETNAYREIPVAEQSEVLTLLGNVSTHDGNPKVHAHLVVGKRNGEALGGHLIKAYVRPTLEVVLTESPGSLRRVFDPQTGLLLLNVE